MAARPMRQTEGEIRSFHPLRDVEAVVELIGMAFGDRLDPAGQATLAQMRRFAHSGPLWRWFWLFMGRATAAPGLVWDDGGRIVGNVSLRRARGSRGGYLIGNVVVHPDWRGEGIGRALMRAAMDRASAHGARWVGLEVRADNDVARQLYGDLRFQEVGSTRHMLRPAGVLWTGSSSLPASMRRAHGRDAEALVQLMLAAIPREHRPLLEIQESDYRPGLDRAVEHWLRGQREVWWVVENGGEISAAVRAVRRSGRFPNQLEILVRPGHEGRFETALVRRGIASLRGSARKPIEVRLPMPGPQAVKALEEEGFETLRVLVQMKRSLRRRISIDVTP